MNHHRSSVIACVVAAAAIAATAAASSRPAINLSRGQLALRGYDAVAYWTEGRPTQGRAEFAYQWNGALWRFATAASRDMFAKEPAKYAPAFGGYCAYAVSRGYTADGDPTAWRIVDGRLYLNYSRRVQALWEEDIPGNIAKGHANWPGVLGK